MKTRTQEELKEMGEKMQQARIQGRDILLKAMQDHKGASKPTYDALCHSAAVAVHIIATCLVNTMEVSGEKVIPEFLHGICNGIEEEVQIIRGDIQHINADQVDKAREEGR